MGEEAVVQASDLMVQIGTDEHAGTCSPEDFHRVVVLVFVGLQVLEHAPTTEGITILVDEAATGTGIFKLLLVVVRQNLRLAGGNLRVGIHHGNDGLNPVGCHFDVGVEEHIIVRLHLTQRHVVARGKAAVAVVFDQTDAREMLTHERHRVVGGSIVGHDDFGIDRVAVGDDIREKLLKEFLSVIVQYDDGHFHAASGLWCFQRRCDHSQLSGLACIKRSKQRT